MFGDASYNTTGNKPINTKIYLKNWSRINSNYDFIFILF